MSNNDSVQIRRWMKTYVENYVDECGEVNCTRMVEDWDSSCGTGEDTLNSDHIAWDIAVKVADEYEAA
jgi:hypothetical protein